MKSKLSLSLNWKEGPGVYETFDIAAHTSSTCSVLTSVSVPCDTGIALLNGERGLRLLL